MGKQNKKSSAPVDSKLSKNKLVEAAMEALAQTEPQASEEEIRRYLQTTYKK